MTSTETERRLSLPSVRPLLQYGRLSDADLVSRANSGDGRALEALVERYSARVSRMTASILGDIEDARDAAQESLLKVSLKLRQFRGDCQFSTWLHRLVVNTCHDLSARQYLRRSDQFDDESDARPDEDGDPSRLVLLSDLRRELGAGLSRLSAEQRRVVLLRDAVGLSYEEIGRVVRLPVGTVKSYVHRGRERLRGRLEEYSTA